MSFLTRQNRQNQPQQPPNRAFGRGGQNQQDQAQAQRKMQQQQKYKLQLQRQIMEKQARKKLELEKIKKEDQKFMKEVQEQNRREVQLKRLEKEKLRKLEDSVQSPPNKKDNPLKENKASRLVLGNLNVSVKQPPQNQPPNQLPKLGFNPAYAEAQNTRAYSAQRIRPYLYEQNQQMNTYYQERIRKHKQQMNLKIDELFHHINSTKDNIRADEEIDKIRRKLRAKQIPYMNSQSGVGGLESRVQLEYENKFFHIPKKNSEVYKNQNNGRSRVLDYQSRSKFTTYNNRIGDSNAKSRAQIDDMYNLPDNNYNSNDRGEQKWGAKPGKDNYLSNRQAIDFEAESILGRIDDFLGKLKN